MNFTFLNISNENNECFELLAISNHHSNTKCKPNNKLYKTNDNNYNDNIYRGNISAIFIFLIIWNIMYGNGSYYLSILHFDIRNVVLFSMCTLNGFLLHKKDLICYDKIIFLFCNSKIQIKSTFLHFSKA